MTNPEQQEGIEARQEQLKEAQPEARETEHDREMMLITAEITEPPFEEKLKMLAQKALDYAKRFPK